MRLVWFLSIALALCACSPTPGFGLYFNVLADVAGEANASCFLTIANGSRSATYNIPPPSSAVPEQTVPLARSELGACHEPAGFSSEVVVDATTQDGAPAVAASRNQCLDVVSSSTFTQQDLFALLGITAQECPKTVQLTLICGTMTLYDAAPLNICVVPQ